MTNNVRQVNTRNMKTLELQSQTMENLYRDKEEGRQSLVIQGTFWRATFNIESV